MMNYRPLVFTLFILFCPIFGFAQGAQQGGDNSLLPEINPQDIEIRSEFQARFPGLRRQPILGFNPTPRVYQIDPNRMPFMESRDEAIADISITELGRPEPPARSILSTPNRTNAYIRAGFGSYLTPELNGYGFYRLNEKSLITADFNFRSSDGHLGYQDSGFRYLDANTKYINKLQDNLKLTVDLGALSDYNDLYNLSDNIQQNFIGNRTSSKTYAGAFGQVSLQKTKNTLEGWKLSAGGNIFSTELDAGNSGFSGTVAERLGNAQFSYSWTGNKLYETFEVTASVEGSSYDLPSSNTTSVGSEGWLNTQAVLEYERLFNFNTRVRGKGGIAYVSDPNSSAFYLVPEIEIKHNFSNALAITGTAFAKPEIQTQQDHHQFNRFLQAENQIQHSYHMGATGEATFQLFDGNRVFGGVDYRHIKNYTYYLQNNFYDLNYADANIFELYAGASQQLVPEKFWFDGKIYFRSPKLTSGQQIPFEEKLGIQGAISYKVVKELTINSWAEYIGTRKAPSTNSDLSAFVLLNAGAEYQVNDTFGVYAKLLNILGQEYEIWDGYQERPFQIFGGLTIKF
jgi:outer membrane cobalamin receptor